MDATLGDPAVAHGTLLSDITSTAPRLAALLSGKALVMRRQTWRAAAQ